MTTKKQYIRPQIEIDTFGSDVLMKAFGPASMPADMCPVRFGTVDYRKLI